jgi:large subunit ribosomal protein L17
LAIAVIKYEKIETTLPKAKELRGFVEKLITKAGVGGDHAHKTVFAALQDKECTKNWSMRSHLNTLREMVVTPVS